MKNNLSKKSTEKFIGLGLYQIAGGLFGLFLTVLLITKIERFTILYIFMVSIPTMLYVYSIYCGVLMVQQKTKGLKHSAINQYLQLVHFAVAGFAFQYASGLYLSAGIDLTESFTLKFNAGLSQWQTSLNTGGNNFVINFNFVALFLIIFLNRLQKKVENEEIENELSQIGQ